MKLIKYFLQRRSVTILLLVLVLAGGLFSYVKMGKLEDAPFTIKQALVLTSYPGASPSEVQSQVTDVLEEAIQSLGELYYLKTENRAGLSKITVYKALEYAENNPNTVLVLSGGKGEGEDISEAEAMYDYLQYNGIPESQLLLEEQSVNTVQNIVFSKKVIDYQEKYKAMVSRKVVPIQSLMRPFL